VSPGWRWRKTAFAAGSAAARPDWQQANPAAIRRALGRALAKPTGGWFVVDASRRIGRRPRGYRIDGAGLVAWRGRDGVLHVAPDACPHMGASLAGACVRENRLVCPWHGLELGLDGRGPWRPLPAHDDGVLLWVRLGDETPGPAPILPPRPELFVDGVVRLEARCEPQDVIANRLDPWHGGHFHPYAFGALEVLEETDDALRVRVEKRILGRLRVEVDATFHCPDARTIVMTIVDGEGLGSVVETHATPICAGRTAIVEATLATSPRPGFRHARRAARWIRPFVERSARRLWVDDAAYAERLYELRQRRPGPGSGSRG
jgi:isorenieratene synthase